MSECTKRVEHGRVTIGVWTDAPKFVYMTESSHSFVAEKIRKAKEKLGKKELTREERLQIDMEVAGELGTNDMPAAVLMEYRDRLKN